MRITFPSLVLSVFLAISGTTAFAANRPILLFPAADEQRVKELIARDPLASQLQDVVVKRAEHILSKRTCEYRIADGIRLLPEARLALHNIVHSAWAWRTTREEQFKIRTIKELDAACSLKDWNPKHFLDTAELATAISIGYDWLFPDLTPDQRARYEDALLNKGVRALATQQTAPWWRGPRNNWTQVCSTGMRLAAQIVRDSDPRLCDPIIAQSKTLLDSCQIFYEPDGGYPEGPTYWGYGTDFQTLSLAQPGANLKIPPILRRSGDFMIHVVGPSRRPFNYADASSSILPPYPSQSWIASRFHDAGQAQHIRLRLRQSLSSVITPTSYTQNLFPFHILWLPPRKQPSQTLKLHNQFRGIQASAYFRSGWEEDAAWLAIKGGTGKALHGHLDAGSFLYEAGRVRWFHDLGGDDYNLPGFFGKNRWNYLRMTNFSHNTLVIDGKLQVADEQGSTISPIRGCGTNCLTATVDLTPCYSGQARKVHRTTFFQQKSGAVILRDTIEKPIGKVRWAVVTRATPRFEGNRVILHENQQTLILERKDKSGGQWEEYSLKPQTDRENPNTGFRLIGFTANAADNLNLEVMWSLQK